MIEVEQLSNGMMFIIVPDWIVWVLVTWAALSFLNLLANIGLKIMHWRLNKEMEKYAEREIKKQVGKHFDKPDH